jgi:hypothetical protein
MPICGKHCTVRKGQKKLQQLKLETGKIWTALPQWEIRARNIPYSDAPGLASSREAMKPKPRLDKPSQAKSTASGGLGLGLGVAEAQAKGSSRGLEGAK